MDNYIIEALESCPLFKSLSREDIICLSECLFSGRRIYKKGEIIISQGQKTSRAGIVLRGEATGYKLLETGERIIIVRHQTGCIFGEILSFAAQQMSPVTVETTSHCEIMWMDCKNILRICEKTCQRHTTVIENLLAFIADSFIEQQKKIMILSQKRLRDKITVALSFFSPGAGANTFNLPFDRATFADYLGADRSAVSRELSRLRAAGAIEFYKNSFKILDPSILRPE